MPCADERVHRLPGRLAVVDHHRVEVEVRDLAVDEHDGDAVVDRGHDMRDIRSLDRSGRDDDAVDALVDEHVHRRDLLVERSCVLSTIVSKPRSRDASEMPRTTPAKNGLPMSATMTPRVCVMPVDMLRASAFAR